MVDGEVEDGKVEEREELGGDGLSEDIRGEVQGLEVSAARERMEERVRGVDSLMIACKHGRCCK